MELPVLIPNTVVKRCTADDTREGKVGSCHLNSADGEIVLSMRKLCGHVAECSGAGFAPSVVGSSSLPVPNKTFSNSGARGYVFRQIPR